ncbi:MAG: FKBP-type peptidylprolyl isomerase [Clostridiales bacterium]|nr:FKBP-type peptidylprolyl isomerase [Clostridiales bacterium]
MKESVRRTALAALVCVTTAGMLAGCGDSSSEEEETALDGSAVVATVDGEEIEMGVLSLNVRMEQAETEELYAYYAAYLGSTGSYSIWDTEADEDTGETYGEQARSTTLENLELAVLEKQNAADYGVELTEEDEESIAEAAAAFMEANTEETLADLAVTEEQVKTYLELETYAVRVSEAIKAEAEVDVSDEEAQQSAFTYVKVSIDSDDLTEDEIDAAREDAQEILDQMLEDPTQDMGDVAAAVNEDYYDLSGTYTTYVEEDEEDESSSYYDEELLAALRELEEDGEMVPELVETDTALYIARLDSLLDEEATAEKKEGLEDDQRDEYYTEVTDGWKEEAEITEDEDVLATLVVTDSHAYTVEVADTTASDSDATASDADATDSDATASDADGTASDADGSDSEEED